MSTAAVFVGLDVAKTTLDVAVRPSGEHWNLPNDEPGVRDLVERLRPLAPSLVVCEATGGFERAAIGALAAVGFPIVVANPRQIRDFGRATGQLAKTDRLDAATLALFAERVRPTPRPLPDDAAQLLDALLTRGGGSCWRCSLPRKTASALHRGPCSRAGEFVVELPAAGVPFVPGTIVTRLWGFPVTLIDQMPKASDSAASTKFIAFGDPRHIVFGDRQDLEVAVSEHASFAADETQVRAVARLGLAITRPAAFSVLRTSAV